MTAAVRLARSILSIPANNPRMIEKGLASNADMAFLDLEDATAPAQKVEARAAAITAVNDADWGRKPRMVRINAVGTPWFARDLIEIVEQAGDRIDLLLIPKVDSVADIHAVDRVIDSIAPGKSIAIEAQIESAAALVACDQIASASARLEALVYGPGDLAASLRLPGRNIGMRGEWDAKYGSDRLHYPLMRILVAARANGLRAIDGPFADFRDSEGLRHAAEMTHSLGYDGKWCIHPGQIEIVNDVFSPDAEEIEAARAVVAAYSKATASGSGAVVHQGVMIDAATVRMAETTIRLAERARH